MKVSFPVNGSLGDCLGPNAASPKIPQHLIGQQAVRAKVEPEREGGGEREMPNLIQKSAIYVVMTKRRSRVTKSPTSCEEGRGRRQSGKIQVVIAA